LFILVNIRIITIKLINKETLIYITTLLLITGCEKDPIFGLKKGWLRDWNNNKDEIYDITIEFSFGEYMIDVQIWDGNTNVGNPDVNYSLSPGDARTLENNPEGEYVIKISNGYKVETNNLYLDSDCTIIINNSSQDALIINWWY
tara:strand:- start:48 stop:482 length:435 start_codon:yes stop_codon:yes gene_type:complete